MRRRVAPPHLVSTNRVTQEWRGFGSYRESDHASSPLGETDHGNSLGHYSGIRPAPRRNPGPTDATLGDPAAGTAGARAARRRAAGLSAGHGRPFRRCLRSGDRRRHGLGRRPPARRRPSSTPRAPVERRAGRRSRSTFPPSRCPRPTRRWCRPPNPQSRRLRRRPDRRRASSRRCRRPRCPRSWSPFRAGRHSRRRGRAPSGRGRAAAPRRTRAQRDHRRLSGAATNKPFWIDGKALERRRRKRSSRAWPRRRRRSATRATTRSPRFEAGDKAKLAEADIASRRWPCSMPATRAAAASIPRRLSKLITPTLYLPSTTRCSPSSRGATDAGAVLAAFNPPHAGYRRPQGASSPSARACSTTRRWCASRRPVAQARHARRARPADARPPRPRPERGAGLRPLDLARAVATSRRGRAAAPTAS